jgi:hypothetical protein
VIAIRRSARRGAALFMVLGAAMIVFGALGFGLRWLAVSTVRARHEAARAEARALAQGAWAAARHGLAESGSSYAGFGEKPLGRGTISVVLERHGEEIRVKASARLPRGPRLATALVVAVVRVDDSKPAGRRLAQCADVRLK